MHTPFIAPALLLALAQSASSPAPPRDGAALSGAWLLVDGSAPPRNAPRSRPSTGTPGSDVGGGQDEQLGFCNLPISYCPATASSTGMPAELAWSGSVSVADDALVLTTSPLPTGQLATLFYGLGRADVPFGNGTLCVDPAGLGYVVRLRVATIPGFNPMLTHFIDFDEPFTPPEAALMPGTTWNFQTWFRDPAGGGAEVNFSNALEITVCP